MKEQKYEAKKIKVNMHSLKTKINFLLLLVIIMTTGINIWTAIPLASDSITNLNQNHLYDLVVAYGNEVDMILSEDTDDHTEIMKEVLEGVGLKGIESSYIYVVKKDGTMLYHPTTEKIGKPVENQAITEVVKQLDQGKIPDPTVIHYNYKGVIKYAAYYITPNTNDIVVITADEAEVLEPISEIIIRIIAGGIFALIVTLIIGYIISCRLVSPINKATKLVTKFADLDFIKDDEQDKLNKRKDETGEMSRAITSLRESLLKVISQIKEQGDILFNSSEVLSTNASETATTIEQVEHAVHDMAAGASSQAEETQKATEHVMVMGDMIEETNKAVTTLNDHAKQIKKSSEVATGILNELDIINQKVSESIDVIYSQTNTTNESALKIKEAIALITSIADETNLLSLNASIEAARAGEQGRGFAVVATQIQKLAEQSNDSARKIEEIISSLINDSTTAVGTMKEVKEIIEKQNEKVEKTNKIFSEVKEGIDHSIEGVQSILERTQNMDKARVKVVDIVHSLSAIADQNAASTQETSASATEVSSIMSSVSENASQLKEIANSLEKNMSVFKI